MALGWTYYYNFVSFYTTYSTYGPKYQTYDSKVSSARYSYYHSFVDFGGRLEFTYKYYIPGYMYMQYYSYRVYYGSYVLPVTIFYSRTDTLPAYRYYYAPYAYIHTPAAYSYYRS